MAPEGGGVRRVVRQEGDGAGGHLGSQDFDVYAVGADPGDGRGPLVLSYIDGDWRRLTTGASGDQFKLADLIMRRGAFASLAYGGAGECDAGYDLYAALGGTADGKWPAGATSDGTHPAEALHVAAAADLGPRLPELLGF